MNTAKKTQNRHEVRRDALIRKIGATGPFIEGSLNAVRRHGCREPGWQLTWKQRGKTRTVYVPMALVPEVKGWVKAHRQLKTLVRNVTAQSLAVIREYTARRRAAARGPASARKR